MHIRKLFRISERPFSDLGATVYTRLHLIFEMFRITRKSIFRISIRISERSFIFVMMPRLTLDLIANRIASAFPYSDYSLLLKHQLLNINNNFTILVQQDC